MIEWSNEEPWLRKRCRAHHGKILSFRKLENWIIRRFWATLHPPSGTVLDNLQVAFRKTVAIKLQRIQEAIRKAGMVLE
jgi:hypothetical protein